MKPEERLFIGFFAAGVVYADRAREARGDFARVGFLSYATLELQIEVGAPRVLIKLVHEHARGLKARRGQTLQVTTSGQTVMLGASTREGR